MVIQVYALTSNAEEAEVEQFYEDLSSVQFNCSVVSDSLPSHGLEHARLPVHH